MEYTVGKEHLRVLDGVDLDVQRNERLSITGVSGSGKTTLLHILGALEKPTEGAIYMEGDNIYTMSDATRSLLRAKRIGYVFQSYHLLPELDVLENVVLPSMSSPGWMVRSRESRARAESLLERVGLADRARHRPVELSGGEQQRAALARALMNEPDLIFADEPTGNLDEHTSERVLSTLMEITDELDRTLLMVTHNPQIAARCERQMRLEDGHLHR